MAAARPKMRGIRQLWAVCLSAALFGCSTAPVSQNSVPDRAEPVWTSTVYDQTGADPYVWEPIASMPVPLSTGPSGVHDGKLYLFGGLTTHLRASGAVVCYDPAADRWTSVAEMPVAMSHNRGVVYGDRFWIAGGAVGDNPGPPTDQVWIFDFRTNEFTEGPPLPEARMSPGVALLDHTMYVAAGVGPDRDTKAFEMWALDLDNPAGWRQLAPIPHSRTHFALVGAAGKLYAIGGMNGHGGGLGPWDDVTWVDVYNPETGTWAAGPGIPKPNSHFEGSTMVVGDWILTAGGRSIVDSISDVWALHIPTGEWKVVAVLPDRLWEGNTAIIGDHVYTAGGRIDRRQPTAHGWRGPLTHTWKTVLDQ